MTIVASEVCKFPRVKLMSFTSKKPRVHKSAVAASPILAAAPLTPLPTHAHTYAHIHKETSQYSLARLP